MGRFRTAGVAAVLMLAAAPPLLPAGAAGCSGVRSVGQWQRIATPKPEPPATGLVDHLVLAYQPGIMLATDGVAVHRSTNAGCAWNVVHRGGITLVEGETGLAVSQFTRVLQLGAATTPTAGRHLFLLVEDDILRELPLGGERRVRRPRVLVSEDLGSSWVDRLEGLPPVGDPIALWVAPSAPRSAYVAIRDVGTGEQRLYRTTDGATWAAVGGPRALRGLTIHPAHPDQIWAWDATGLLRSADGGATFTAVAPARGAVSAVGVVQPPGGGTEIHAFHPDGRDTVSRDGGATWSQEASVPTGDGVAFGFFAEPYAVTSGGVVWAVGGGRPKPEQISPRGVTGLVDPSGTVPNPQMLFARRVDSIWRGVAPRPTSLPPVVLPPNGWPPLDLRPPRIKPPLPPRLLPPVARVDLPAGGEGERPYLLDLPPTPTPLDVMLVLDSTSSMDPVFGAVRQDIQDIVNDLADAGVDAWFGAADFKEYPFHPQALAGGYPYQRRRAVGPVNNELREAIDGIVAEGGTLDGRNAALEAAFQAATGLGREVVPLNGKGPYLLPAGQGAKWRRDSLKIVVLATDIEMRKPGLDEPTYPGPSPLAVITAMNRLGVGFVGLSLKVPDTRGRPTGLVDLRTLARGTGTLAPSHGVDCDEDGRSDVSYGDPLVCEFDLASAGTDLARALVALLNAVADYQSVSLEVAGGPRGLARVLEPRRYHGINVKAENKLDFTVGLSCPSSAAGELYRLTVRARVAGQVVRTARLDVGCGVVPGLPLPPPPPAGVDPPASPPRLVGAAVLPPPPPPPAPVPHTNPVTNPNPAPQPNPNPATNVQAQIGAAQQEQEEVQVALAYVDAGLVLDDDYALSRREQPAPVGMLAAAAVMSAASMAVLLRRRSRGAVAVAPVRRS